MTPTIRTGGEGGWLPIETAPRDGRQVLLFAPTRAFPCAIVVGRFSTEYKVWVTEPGMWQRAPTHWCALPPAPGAA